MLSDRERLDFLAKIAETCGELFISYNEEIDGAEPLGFTVSFGTCSPIEASAASLRDAIDLAYLEAESGV